jgi:hypothetical protein
MLVTGANKDFSPQYFIGFSDRGIHVYVYTPFLTKGKERTGYVK